MSLRIGVIGVGGLGYLQAKTYRTVDGVDIVGAADIAADARDLFEREFQAPALGTYQELLDEYGADLDAVMIVTPHELHYEQAMAALEADLHLLIEKPMVTKTRQAADIAETAAARDLVVQIGYQRHFHPAFTELRRFIREGRIGDLHTVTVSLGQNWIENHRGDWRTNVDLSGGGQLFDTGSHVLDTLLWLTDADPVTVTAQMSFADPGIDVNSALTIELDPAESDRAVTASVGISGDGMDVAPNEGYFFWGSAGRLSYVGDELAGRESDAGTYRTTIESDYDFNTLNERKLQHFVDVVAGRADPVVSAEAGVQVTALTEAAYESAASGSRVTVQEMIDPVDSS
jgi:predicted dehydrogenase